MPSGPNRLRERFMINGSDGIGEAESIIKKHGGIVKRGMIFYPPGIEDSDFHDAIDYLCLEWDYDCEILK